MSADGASITGMRKDGRPLVTEFPITAMDEIPYITREEAVELVKDENVIACRLGPTLAERTAWMDDGIDPDVEEWGT